MREISKVLLVLVLIISSFAIALAWASESWPARIFTSGFGMAVLGVLVWVVLRKDKAPDFLRRVAGPSYFERSGFCFAVVPGHWGKCGALDLFFQNRYDRPCEARVVLRASEGFFLTHRELATLQVEVICPGGAFGVVHVPWAVPGHHRGEVKSFDLAAEVRYPEGRGTMLRFRDGRSVGMAFHNVLGEVVNITGAFGGLFITSRPAQCWIRLPEATAGPQPDNARMATEILWLPGDCEEIGLDLSPWKGHAAIPACEPLS